MSTDAALLEPDAQDLADLYETYLQERDLSMYAVPGVQALPEFYAPVPTPLTLVVRD